MRRFRQIKSYMMLARALAVSEKNSIYLHHTHTITHVKRAQPQQKPIPYFQGKKESKHWLAIRETITG